MNKTKNKFTLKIVISYLVLISLALVAGYFIFSQIKVFVSTDNAVENDAKLLKTGVLLTNIYEAESLSKLALQSRTKKSFEEYSQKIDSVLVEIDTLKTLTQNEYQRSLLDSVVLLLQEKVANSNELLNLRTLSEANRSIDNAIKEFSSIEASLGKITAESMVTDFYNLPPKAQQTLQQYVAYLNENIPRDGETPVDSKKLDSILNVTKMALSNAKLQDLEAQRSMTLKEKTVNQNDLELSRKLQNMVSSFEQEVIVNNYNTSIKKEAALKTSIRLAQVASILGFLIVGVFTFLITKDFWKVQTYREKLENEKKYSESLLKSREQLIATVSHDLRTPLNTISGYSELMEHTGLLGKQIGYIKNVKSAAQYVNSLVNDLLDFSKLEAGKIKIENIPFVLADLIKETAENLKEIHSKKPITLILDIDEKLETTVLGDPFRIRQILSNLIGNAYKFTHQGTIKIDAFAKESKGVYDTTIKITDSGVGIKKEKQEEIFKEFTQADEKTEKKYGGYGLGLTISKKLTSLLKGTITVTSEEHKGSIFTIRLPLTLVKTSKSIPPKKMTTLQKRLSILIIDDDLAMLRLLKEVCEIEKIETYIYSDFNKIDQEKEMAYDLVLTDIQMPFIDGFEVMEKLRSSAYTHYKNQPIVAMTGRKDLQTEIYKKAGFQEILQKPFTKTCFLETLSTLFPEKPIVTEKEGIQTSNSTVSTLFNLDVISAFLGDSSESINEILEAFVMDTKTNLELLKLSVETKKHKDVQAIAHRMLPMFRQLKANEIIPILESLEQHHGDKILDNKTLQVLCMRLQHKTTALLLALDVHLSKGPSYNG